MLEIKYRAYVKHLQIIIEVQRINFDCKTVEWYIVHPDEWDMSEFSFDEVEIMQYTWLKDKKLEYIYEMDIISPLWNIIWNFYENSNLLETDSNLLIKGMGTKEWEETYKEAYRRWCEYAE